MAELVVVHRQQCERPRGIEDLIRDMLMSALVPKHRDDRLMVVLPARDVDPRRLAGPGVSAVGRHEQRCRELASVLKRDHHAVVAAIDLGHARFPQRPDVLARLGAGMERGAEAAVLVHETERLAVIGIEVQAAGL